MEKKLDPQHLDVVNFARDALSLKGEGVLADWPRLAQELFGKDMPAGPVVWQLQGRSVPQSGGADQIWLDLKAWVNLPVGPSRRPFTRFATACRAWSSGACARDKASAMASG